MAQSFITNEAAVEELTATTAKPRPHMQAEKDKIRRELREGLAASQVPYAVRDDYLEALLQYEDTFSADKDDVGLSDIIQHTIEVKDKEDLAYIGQFRLAFDHLQLIKDNVAGWLRAGLIERAESKFNAPVFCVPMKEGHGL